MSETLLSVYLEHLQRLIDYLKSNENGEDYTSALVFQGRFIENVEQTKLHGDTEILRFNRSVLVSCLNEITERIENRSFLEFCGLTNQSPGIVKPLQPGLLLSASNYVAPLFEVVQEGIIFLSKDDTVWPDECKRLSKKFQHFRNYDIPSDNPTLMQIRVHLLYLDQQIEFIINLLDTYCPECDKPGERLRKQRQTACEKLRTFHYEIESVITSINALSKT